MDDRMFEELLSTLPDNLPEAPPDLVEQFAREAREVEKTLTAAKEEKAPMPERIENPSELPRKMPPPHRGERPNIGIRAKVESRRAEALERDMNRSLDTPDMSLEVETSRERDRQKTTAEVLEAAAQIKDNAAPVSERAKALAERAESSGQRRHITLSELKEMEAAAKGLDKTAEKAKDMKKGLDEYKKRRTEAAKQQGMKM